MKTQSQQPEVEFKITPEWKNDALLKNAAADMYEALKEALTIIDEDACDAWGTIARIKRAIDKAAGKVK